jgi:hypothetical protein
MKISYHSAMEIPTTGINPDIEKLLLGPEFRVEINGYASRGKVTLSVNGEIGEWDSFKGGVQEDPIKHDGDMYEVLAMLGPDSNPEKWLKLVPARSIHYGKLRNRLQHSLFSGQKALEVADMPELAAQFQECTVIGSRGDNENHTVYGFVSPHLGRTVQSFLVDIKRGRIPAASKPELFDFLAQVYGIAYKHAAVLFAREGVWMDDPNPGNIVLHQSERGIQVALIDFANSKQGNPVHRGGLTEDELRKKVYTNPGSLYHKFKKQSDMHRIPFCIDLDPVLEIITAPSIKEL